MNQPRVSGLSAAFLLQPARSPAPIMAAIRAGFMPPLYGCGENLGVTCGTCFRVFHERLIVLLLVSIPTSEKPFKSYLIIVFGDPIALCHPDFVNDCWDRT